MSLIHGTGAFLTWSSSVIWHFTCTAPWRTCVVIGSSIGEKISTLLAFFLPLKVILLLGSDGVPKYFRGFITPDTRDEWIIFLAGAAVVCYLLSLLLGRIGDRYAVVGSGRVLREATQLAVLKSQVDVAKNFYVQLCQVASSMILSTVLLAVVFYFYAGLFLFLVATLAFEYLFSAGILSLSDSRRQDYLAILANTNGYLTLLASINFLLVFGFLLVEFVFFSGVNILIAILSVLVTRLLFQNLTTFVAESVKLSRSKEKVNTLVFSDHQWKWQDTPPRLLFRNHYGQEERTRRIANLIGVENSEICSNYTDKGPKDISVFELSVRNEGGETKNLVELVYEPSKYHLAENEDTLFRHVDRSRLSAAKLQHQYMLDRFSGRVYEGGDALDPAAWNRIRRGLLVKAWAVEPSKNLQAVFCAARPYLHERFNVDLVESLEVGLDSKEEQVAYTEVMESLPNLCSSIQESPLFVLNNGLSPGMTVMGCDGASILYWGNWTLAPIGAGFDFGKDQYWLENELEKVLPKNVSFSNALLNILVADLERKIHRGRIKSAVRLLPEIAKIAS